ncbi:MAG: amidase, partial [Rhodospirillaceae bacterium]
MGKTLQDIRLQLQRGEVTSEQLVEEALASVKSSEGQGDKTFIKVYDDNAMVQAKAIDQVRKSGVELHPLAGIPISIKDLFDVAGEITLSGSIVKRKSIPAKYDAHIVSKLRAAGAILIGRTNMTEFAFSGLGINPHYGTPLNPWDRKMGRIPGGSSSGAAISVTDNMAAAAIGTDTGGSVRIPSALCGLTGFKPTAVRVSKEGAFPLSTTLDSIGPLANSVSCCSILDQTMRGAAVNALLDKPVDGLTLAIPQTIVLDDMDRTVAEKFENILKRLSESGVRIVEHPCSILSQIPLANSKGGFAAVEAFHTLRDLLEKD